MPFDDFRSFLTALRAQGQLIEVDRPVALELEVAKAMRKSAATGGPAIVFNNNGVYRGTDVNAGGGADVAPTVFVKNARYDKLMESVGGVGVRVTTPEELSKALEASIKSGKPTLIDAIIDPAAGVESGRIGNLNIVSTVGKKKK